MRNRHAGLKKLLPLVLLLPLAAFGAADNAAPAPLDPLPQQGLIEQLVATYATRLHYANRQLDDALSQDIFERYLDTLDPSRIYFTRADIAEFEKYRSSIDDALLKGNVEPAYAMYGRLRERVLERIDFARAQLASKPDFAVKEYFAFDRAEADWAKTAGEL